MKKKICRPIVIIMGLLGGAMIGIGLYSNLLPPILTGVGFFLIVYVWEQ